MLDLGGIHKYLHRAREDTDCRVSSSRGWEREEGQQASFHPDLWVKPQAPRFFSLPQAGLAHCWLCNPGNRTALLLGCIFLIWTWEIHWYLLYYLRGLLPYRFNSTPYHSSCSKEVTIQLKGAKHKACRNNIHVTQVLAIGISPNSHGLLAILYYLDKIVLIPHLL